MYAIVRENRFDPAKLARGERQFAEFQKVHSQQPGYAGTIVVDTGQGRQLSVNLWETEDDARAALPVMVPVLQQQIASMLAEPSQVIGAGTVLLTDVGRQEI